MKKKIWILNHYAGNMFFNQGGRHYWFADFLSREGYKPTVFVSNTKHNPGTEFYFDMDTLWEEHVAEQIGTPFVFVKSRTYSGNGKDRVLNMMDFYHNVIIVAKQYSKLNGCPDIIYASSVHPLTLVAGIKIAKYFCVKCICEMRDLWPEAIIAYSSKIKKTSFLAKLLYKGEKMIYKKADALIFTQEGGLDYIVEKGWDKEHGGSIDMKKAFYINNGVDLEAFDRNVKEFWLEDSDMDDSEAFKVVYAGAIRRINNVGLLLDAAKLIRNPRIKFVIWGDGDELEQLKKRVEDETINNVVFKGNINKKYIPSIDVRSDVNVVHWEMNSLLRVGESFNKAFEYFAAGKPVFYTIRPGYSIVEKYKCGKLTEGFEPKDIAKGIEMMEALPEDEKKRMSTNARAAAEQFDFRILTQKLIDIIEKI